MSDNAQRMKAVVQTGYGSIENLAVREVDVPVPGEGEVLVRVKAAAVHPDVWHVVTGFPWVLRLMGNGVARPSRRIPGIDMAGTVEAVGPKVARFKPGDHVFGETIRGMQWVNGGAYAERVAAPEECLAHKPDSVSFEQAGSIATAGLIILMNLRPLGDVKGKSILVNGAAGGVGSVAIQVLVARGAEVTAVDRGDRLEATRALGAQHVIDYTQEDFTRGSKIYDGIVDIPGNHPYSALRRVLAPSGRYVLIAHDDYGRSGRRLFGQIPRMFGLVAQSFFDRRIPREFSTPPKAEGMEQLRQLVADGQITPVVDRAFKLDEAPAALRYLMEGQARGRIVISP